MAALIPGNIKYIVVHCSYTEPDMDIGAKEITEWHKAQGWQTIGYHFVIRRNGQVEKGRELSEMGAHVQGYNDKSIGICMVGGEKEGKAVIDEINFTPEQWYTLSRMLLALSQKFPGAKIVGHNDLTTKKTCPCFNVAKWLGGLLQSPSATA